MSVIYFVIIILGFFCGFLLFIKFPKMRNQEVQVPNIKLSVVIPARNEQTNLALILKDLERQIFKPFEIICVDDGSTDNTKNVINRFGATYLAVVNKTILGQEKRGVPTRRTKSDRRSACFYRF